MDSLGGLLDAPRARGAFALRASMTSPWSLRVLAESPLTLIVVVSGDLWLLPDRGEALHLRPGDVAVTRAPDHYSVADAPDTPSTIYIHPNQDCRDAAGNSLLEALTHGVRSWGNDPEGETVFVVGAYEQLSDIRGRLLEALPPALMVSRSQWESPLVPLLCGEVTKDEPGQAAVLDRLLDLLVTAVLKAWFARQDERRPAWWRYQSDRIVESALQLMHERPQEAWTVASLAQQVGASRAAFAKRFQDIVGESPMAFLKHWRMALAADLLCRPGENVSTVSVKVGYATPYAFSAAFKRVRGLSPQQHRDHVLLQREHQ